MKKGCFLKILFLLTIIVGGVSYIVTNKLDEYIISPIRQFTLKQTLGESETALKATRESAERTQLIQALNSYKNDAATMRTLSLGSLGAIADSLEKITLDGEILKSEVDGFCKFLAKVKEDEKRKKNRD